MRTPLSYLILPLLCTTTLVLSGCAKMAKSDQYQTSVLEKLPFVYKMTVQQGNVINEGQVAQLQPGMNKRQVAYLLGTPVLTDFFNADRWDYVYTIRRGHQPEEQHKLTIWFKDDALVRMDGNLQPKPGRNDTLDPKEVVVTVPDYQERKGLFSRMMDSFRPTPKKP
jgi:outer membrane protein assembly factor BamE